MTHRQRYLTLWPTTIHRLPLILLLLVLLLPLCSDALLKKSFLSCGGYCYLTKDTRKLLCSENAPSDTRLVLDCIASRVRNGIRILIGTHQKATSIHPKGLDHLNRRFAGEQLFLRLAIKFTHLNTEPLRRLPGLRNLTVTKSGLNPCIFADGFSGRLRSVSVECMGIGIELHQPFQLFWPRRDKNPPEVTLLNCGVAPSCVQCQNEYRGTVMFNAKGIYLLRKLQRHRLSHCQEETDCPRAKIQNCSGIIPSTTTEAPPTTTAQTTTEATTTPASTQRDNFPIKPQRVNTGEDRVEERVRDEPNLRQLVGSLGKRVYRTKRFLIIILVVCVVNSLVLVSLLVYLCRRCRFCCGESGKGIYVITKAPNSPKEKHPNQPFLDNNNKTPA